MMGGYQFYINDMAWNNLKNLLPKMKRGLRRINDRKIISGIVYILQSGVM
jgi:transposase